MTSLRGFVETVLLKNDTLSVAERRDYLAIALRQSERLTMLVEELFDLERLDYEGESRPLRGTRFCFRLPLEGTLQQLAAQ